MRFDRSDKDVDDYGGKAIRPHPDDRDAGRRAREQDLLRELAEVTGWGTHRRQRREKGRSDEQTDKHP
jgi:hypothetical protein